MIEETVNDEGWAELRLSDEGETAAWVRVLEESPRRIDVHLSRAFGYDADDLDALGRTFHTLAGQVRERGTEYL